MVSNITWTNQITFGVLVIEQTGVWCNEHVVAHPATIRDCYMRLNIAATTDHDVLAYVAETTDEGVVTDFSIITYDDVVPNGDVFAESHVLADDDSLTYSRSRHAFTQFLDTVIMWEV